MAELVDARDLKSLGPKIRAGSSPALGKFFFMYLVTTVRLNWEQGQLLKPNAGAPFLRGILPDARQMSV